MYTNTPYLYDIRAVTGKQIAVIDTETVTDEEQCITRSKEIKRENGGYNKD
jgi:hypothetical protein